MESGEDFSGWETRVFLAKESVAGSPMYPSGLGHLAVSQLCIGLPPCQGNIMEEVVSTDLSKVWRLRHQGSREC